MSTTGDNRSKSPSGNDTQNRKKHPCVLCQQRKVKCDRNDPCQNCTKARIECIPASALPPRRRKKRFPEAELLARLKKYEEHLKAYGADIDAINREDGPVPSKLPPEIKHRHDPHSCSRPGVDIVKPLSVRRSLRHVENNLWNGMNKEFRDAEELLQGSSDDETFDSPITKTYDAIGSDASDLLFPTETTGNLIDLHPPPMQIFRLWQNFIDNVNPLIKILHAPTVQQQILDATADLGRVSKGTEVLMFGIYATAIMSMTDADVESMFGEEKPKLLAQYQSGCRQALLRAGFLRSSDMTILQGFFLYLLSGLNFSIDPRALFCLTGISIRIAQRMGLNVDGTAYGLLPFEVEMRRRLWWQLLLLDTRVGELSGYGPSLHMHMWTTKLPSNVNDSSLFPDLREPPVEHPGATEMLFVLQRCEVAQFLYQTRRMCGPFEMDDAAIDAFEAMLQEKYLKYCDAQVPMHYISSAVAQSSIHRLRMGPHYPSLMSSKSKEMPEQDLDKLFHSSLAMLENHHNLMGTKSISRFFWHIYTNFPFPAHVYLVCALRYRTTGDLAERAWKQLEASFNRRSEMAKRRGHHASNLHMAMANLTVKSWEARESALREAQSDTPTPIFILQFREKLASRKSSNSATQSDASPPEIGNQVGNQFEDAYQWLNQQPPFETQSFDQSNILMPDSSNMDWSFWNGIGQVPVTDFDNMLPNHGQGFYQS
ncbi:Aurofusarin cluster transcription factor [Lachnellula occidentalis]|uniref:Aurofusarin cluster transcription factor n=1 Tax=Lachnellula occidentalis TaxID=215460 RepID=A0A8H8UCT0_9HELO|nr:Aurofusarin cluster transcription factor [Lachnellula occidentalis]